MKKNKTWLERILDLQSVILFIYIMYSLFTYVPQDVGDPGFPFKSIGVLFVIWLVTLNFYGCQVIFGKQNDEE